MAEPENIHQVPNPNLIFYGRYYDYEGPCQRVVYFVEEFYFDDCRIIYTLTPRAFVDLH